MVMPSLQTIGAPQLFWMSTDLDFGPKVTRTASHKRVAPCKIFSRAAERNRTCLWAMGIPHFHAGTIDMERRRRGNTIVAMDRGTTLIHISLFGCRALIESGR